MDRIWRDLIGGWILMLVGSGRILRSLMDGMGMIAMEGGGDMMDGEASSLGISAGEEGSSCGASINFRGDSHVGDGGGGWT